MAINVSLGGSSRTTKVSVGSTNVRLSTTTAPASQKVTSAKVEQLANVDITTNGLEDGYTIVYDEDTGKWVSQAISTSVQLDTLDGGTY